MVFSHMWPRTADLPGSEVWITHSAALCVRCLHAVNILFPSPEKPNKASQIGTVMREIFTVSSVWWKCLFLLVLCTCSHLDRRCVLDPGGPVTFYTADVVWPSWHFLIKAYLPYLDNFSSSCDCMFSDREGKSVLAFYFDRSASQMCFWLTTEHLTNYIGTINIYVIPPFSLKIPKYDFCSFFDPFTCFRREQQKKENYVCLASQRQSCEIWQNVIYSICDWWWHNFTLSDKLIRIWSMKFFNNLIIMSKSWGPLVCMKLHCLSVCEWVFGQQKKVQYFLYIIHITWNIYWWGRVIKIILWQRQYFLKCRFLILNVKQNGAFMASCGLGRRTDIRVALILSSDAHHENLPKM